MSKFDEHFRNKMDFGMLKFPFKPKLIEGRWYIVEISKISLFSDAEFCDPNAFITMRASIRISTVKKVQGWVKPKEENYETVWVNLDDGEFINYDKNPMQSFRHDNSIKVYNGAEVIEKVRARLSGEVEEDKEDAPEHK